MINTVRIYASSPQAGARVLLHTRQTWFITNRVTLDDPEEWFHEQEGFKQDALQAETQSRSLQSLENCLTRTALLFSRVLTVEEALVWKDVPRQLSLGSD